jgi:hypothetical protein
LEFAEPKDGARRRSPEKLQFGDQKLAAGDKLNGKPELVGDAMGCFGRDVTNIIADVFRRT